MKYLVVDGYALAYRAYHAYPELSNGNRDTRVTVGFFNQLVTNAAKELEADGSNMYEWIFVFDSKGGCFRQDLDANYKANRSSSTPDFYEQVEEVVKLCKMLGKTYRITGYEADDLAGSFVKQYVGPEDSALLLTVDKDWLQLLSENIEVLQLKPGGKSTRWTRELFYESYEGLLPEQLVDIKALQGDGSDNIPSIKGCGWVTVQRLLREYKTVDNLYDNIMKVTNKGHIQSNLMNNKERALLNKRLATIRTDIELESPANYVADYDGCLDYVQNELMATALANKLGYFLAIRKAERK